MSKQEEPNEIVVQIGSLTATELGNERGFIRIQIKEEERRSQVSVRFSFVMPYLVSTAYWCSVWLILIFAVSLVFPQIWLLAFMYSQVLVFLTIVLVGLGVGYSVGKTRERFLSQLSLFFRTLECRRSGIEGNSV